jgi:hypothetical protein
MRFIVAGPEVMQSIAQRENRRDIARLSPGIVALNARQRC